MIFVHRSVDICHTTYDICPISFAVAVTLEFNLVVFDTGAIIDALVALILLAWTVSTTSSWLGSLLTMSAEDNHPLSS
jgi:hypothetical protein